MLMPAGEFNDLGHFGFRHFEGEDAANAHAMAMDMQHHVHRLLAGLAEDFFQDMDDELHRRVVVVQQQHLVERRLLGLGARFGDDAGAGIARPVLPSLLSPESFIAAASLRLILARNARLPSGISYLVTCHRQRQFQKAEPAANAGSIRRSQSKKAPATRAPEPFRNSRIRAGLH